jgi:hypothetical protein
MDKTPEEKQEYKIVMEFAGRMNWIPFEEVYLLIKLMYCL